MKKSDNIKTDWSEIEIYKFEFEYLKHLTTISTGSILLIITFLDKLFKKPQWKFTVAIALCCFVLSIILCAISQVTILDKVSEKKSSSTRSMVQGWTIGLLLFALLSYIVGISFLVVFGIKNLL